MAFVFACLTAEKPRGGFAYGANGKEMVKKKSIWQDEENDEEDEEEENKEKDENDNTERDEVENIEVVVEEEMEET